MPSTLVALSSRSASISMARSAAARVGGEERIAGAGGEDDDAALLEVAHGAAADVVLAHLVDADRDLHARRAAQALDGVLHRQRVHDGGQHAHVVAGDAVHAGPREAGAAEDVAAADDARPPARRVCWISSTSLAMRLSTSGSMPYSVVPISASPDSLTRMRLYRRGHVDSPLPFHRSAAAHFAIKKTPRKAGFSCQLVLGLPAGRSCVWAP